MEILSKLSEERKCIGTGRKNHRILKVVGDLCKSSGPTPLLKQGHLAPIAKGQVQMALNISKEGDSSPLWTTHANALSLADRTVFPDVHKITE
ncbi:hypothetical protein BTVI_157711 [Pitangus sulphuratus]|nr:hypothetical protein BTVI_157711 [Pitangus sulphuratus]